MIIQAVLKTRHLDGIEIMEPYVPLGKKYLVDLDTRCQMMWNNEENHHCRVIEAVMEVMTEMYIPIEILELKP
uniref:Uncharacterized protein n=1 Tax=viral metagenome TaxID=1070528 RepID=A0A6M3L933_9ZZZZ